MSTFVAQADHEPLLGPRRRCRIRSRCLRQLCRVGVGGDIDRLCPSLAVGAEPMVSRRASRHDWRRGRGVAVGHYLSANDFGKQSATNRWRNRTRRVLCRALGARSSVLRRATVGIYGGLLFVRGHRAGDFCNRTAQAGLSDFTGEM